MPHPIRGRSLAQMNRPGWSAFGLPRTDSAGGRHNGNDYYAPEGTTIYGTGQGGVVTGSYYSPGNLGWVVEVTYPGYWTQDCHQPGKGAPVGMAVGPNAALGVVGHTGNADDVIWYTAEGALRHDHHVVWVDGVRVDPIAFYGASTAGTITGTFTQEKVKNMNLITATGGGGAYLQTENGVSGILGLTKQTVERLQKLDPGESLLLNPEEIQDLDTVLRAIARGNSTSAVVDVNGLAAKLATVLAPQIDGLDEAALALHLVTALNPQFEAVQANINDSPADALASKITK